MSLRLDPSQRFTCSQCGRCCRRWDVFVSEGEKAAYAKQGVARWFRENLEATEGTAHDPFEPVSGWSGFHRIRARPDGACGFLSEQNRCRLHEEMGAASKPLTCRMFPFTFYPAPASTMATASFGCPTIVENRGEAVAEGASRRALESLRDEWSETYQSTAPARQFVAGRSIDPASVNILRDNLLRMLARAERGAIDLRANLRRIAHALEDLTRSRVLQLPDADFAEYITLTLPYAAAATTPAPERSPGRIGRLMQFGFLYAVTASRHGIEHRQASGFSRRADALHLLLHFHGLAPGLDRVDVRALRSTRVDINAPEIQPVAYHYLRASLEAIGARPRPILDDLAISASCLNAACRVAVMNAHHAGVTIDRRVFGEALMESVDLLQAGGSGVLEWALPRLAASVDAIDVLAEFRVQS
jgi:Fe-S-cluster containining protein